MSPFPASPAERTKRRPTPLLLEALLGTIDSNDDYQVGVHRLQQQHALPLSTEVPVRRTFIDYGSQSDSSCAGQQAVSTAPACMSLSTMGSILDDFCGEDDASPSTCSPSDAGRSSGRSSEDVDWPVQGPTAVGADRLPAVLYYMSPTSRKAAGFWARQTSVRSRSSRSAPSQPVGGSEQTQDDAEPAEVGSSASTDEDHDSDDEDRHFCPEYSKDAELPSVGSALHGEGQCKRCCFFPKGRCNNGENCQFCHFAHEKRKPKHKKKTKKHRKSKRMIIADTPPVTPGLQNPCKGQDFGCDEPCLFVSAIIPSQVVVDASFPHATAVAVVPVSFVF